MSYIYTPSKAPGTYRISPELLYSGDMFNGKPNGSGTVVHIPTRSVVYQGQFVDGRYSGEGKLYQNGVLYEEGVFQNGMIKEGVRYDPRGFVYSGAFTNGTFEGVGRIVLPSGFFLRAFFSGGIPMLGESLTLDVSFPSAKECTTITAVNRSMSVKMAKDAIILAESGKTSYVFFFNGDVFVGELENNAPANGMMFKYNTMTFIPMLVGSGKVDSKYKAPRMVVDRENCKYFTMKWRFCCNKQAIRTHGSGS